MQTYLKTIDLRGVGKVSEERLHCTWGSFPTRTMEGHGFPGSATWFPWLGCMDSTGGHWGWESFKGYSPPPLLAQILRFLVQRVTKCPSHTFLLPWTPSYLSYQDGLKLKLPKQTFLPYSACQVFGHTSAKTAIIIPYLLPPSPLSHLAFWLFEIGFLSVGLAFLKLTL